MCIYIYMYMAEFHACLPETITLLMAILQYVAKSLKKTKKREHAHSIHNAVQ